MFAQQGLQALNYQITFLIVARYDELEVQVQVVLSYVVVDDVQ